MMSERVKFYFLSLFLHGLFITSYGIRYLLENNSLSSYAGEAKIIGAVIFWGVCFIFLIRPDCLFFSYKIKSSIANNEPYFSNTLLRGQFWLYKIFLWIFLPLWPFALAIFGTSLPPVVRMYIFMYLGIITIINLDMLFIRYDDYLNKHALNQLGINRIWSRQ